MHLYTNVDTLSPAPSQNPMSPEDVIETTRVLYQPYC